LPADELSATEAALAELASLREQHGPLMLFQSGGCCEGSSPLCLHEGELLVGANDLLLGAIAGTPFYIDSDQYGRWRSPAFVLDLVPGASDTMSLEGMDDVHFVTRTSSVCEGASAPACPPDASVFDRTGDVARADATPSPSRGQSIQPAFEQGDSEWQSTDITRAISGPGTAIGS
jgi:hypothetical protein